MKRADYYRLEDLVEPGSSAGMLQECERELRHRFELGPDEEIPIAIVLGTGWGDAFEFTATHTIRLNEIGAFSELDELEGHERRLELGTIDLLGKPTRVLVLRGRIHMNEDTHNLAVRLMVRLQIEMLIKLGVKKFLLTAAVGGLWTMLEPGDIVVVDSFPSWGNETLPAWTFNEPASALDEGMLEILRGRESDEAPRLRIGPYVFFRGMHFEDRTHDKPRMLSIGGAVVGMSCKPECAVIMDYPDVSAVALGCLSNDSKEKPDHEKHRAALKARAEYLAGVVTTTLEDWEGISPSN